MPSYKRRVDICLYPHPAASKVAATLEVKRDHDFLLFNDPEELLEFNRLVKIENEG
jgi:hypothetical protein